MSKEAVVLGAFQSRRAQFLSLWILRTCLVLALAFPTGEQGPGSQQDIPIRGRSLAANSPAPAAPLLADTGPTASYLAALKDLLSNKKITVRLGLRVRLVGPKELLDPELLLSLQKEDLYNIGGKSGVFSMRVLAMKKNDVHE